jgi:hypothetical protein
MTFSVVWLGEARSAFDQLAVAAERSIRARKAGKKRKPSKAEGLFKQVKKCLDFLATNPRHPGLRTHAYSSMDHPYVQGEKVFEAYAQNQTPGAYRVFWCYGPEKNQITVIAITEHP